MSLIEEKPQPDYNVSEQDLYTGVRMVWISFAEMLTEFMAWKTTYNAAVGTDQLAALEVAKAMPDEAQRDELHASLNKELKPLSENCLINWKQLESYIRDAFSEEVYEVKLNAAGHGFYSGASGENWEDVHGLMNDGSLFIAANTALLTSPGGMPATFEVQFNDAKTAFSAKHDEFLQAKETSKVLRNEKINANNELYHNAMKMCEDGKKISRKEPAKRDQFTWTVVQALISNTQSKHSVKGMVLDADTKLPVGGALVAVLDKNGVPMEGKEATTESDGTYKIIGLKNGQYKLRVEADGYDLSEIEFEIDGGPAEGNVALVSIEP